MSEDVRPGPGLSPERPDTQGRASDGAPVCFLVDQIRLLSPTFAFWHALFLLLVPFLPFPATAIGSAITDPMTQTRRADAADRAVGKGPGFRFAGRGRDPSSFGEVT